MFKKVINAAKRCYNQVVSYFSPVKVAIGTGLMVAAGSASAAVDAAVTTALTTAVTDVGTIGSAVFIVLVSASAFRYLRKVL